MKLSDNFILKEFTDSEVAAKYGIDNTKPSARQIANMVELCINVLEPVREHFKKPVDVSSGFRCPELNFHSGIGGSNTSQHMTGEAADIKIGGVDPKEIFRFIRDNLDYDQVIEEGTWTHTSFRKGNNRKQPLQYRPGQNPPYVDGSKL